MINAARSFAAAALFVTLALLPSCAHRHGCVTAADGLTRGIRVSAEGRSSAPPDEARLTLGVFTEGATADEATTENARRQTRILAVVKPLLPAGAQVQTQNYNLYPVTNENKPTRFQVRNTVEIRLSQLDLVGRIIDAAVQNGANEVQSLTFGIKDSAAARKKALADAATRARTEAEALAAPLGLTITGVRAVENENAQVHPPGRPMMAFAKSDMVANTPIEAGQVDVTAQITVTFDVAPR